MIAQSSRQVYFRERLARRGRLLWVELPFAGGIANGLDLFLLGTP